MSYAFGIDTFGDVTPRDDGTLKTHAEVIRDVIEEGVIADQAGIDAIGIGEHHRPDYAIPAPDMVLAALAPRTERILLGTAVTVLSSDDPVRVHERFATLDALSSGRAEIQIGRGSFTESFPLFGYDLRDYNELFEEKLELYVRLRESQPVTWEGRLTQDLDGVRVYPSLDRPVPAWVGVGGSPESVIRAARHGLPMMLAIIGGDPARFAPYADLYRRALGEFGKDPLPVGFHSPGHIAPTDEEARAEYYEPYAVVAGRIARERGFAPPSPERFREEVEHGALMVGSPETVAPKIAASMRALGAERFDLKVSNGPLPHAATARSIELFGTRVIPMVKEILG